MISLIVIFLQFSSLVLIKCKLSDNKLASNTNGILFNLHILLTSSKFSKEKGCPPIKLVPASILTKAIFLFPNFSILSFNLSISIFPLNLQVELRFNPSSVISSSTKPPSRTT